MTIGTKEPAQTVVQARRRRPDTRVVPRSGEVEASRRKSDARNRVQDAAPQEIPDVVLQKAEELDAREWGFIHSHTLIGQRILGAAPALRQVGAIVRSTHENWDGTGYPDGLAGGAIPLAARIIAACDAYAAITSDRPYRAARTPQEAIAELRRCAGRQFDPQVVELVCAVLADEDEPATLAIGG